MATSTLTRRKGYFYQGYNVQQASASSDNWHYNIGHVSTNLYNEKEYTAACYEFAVPTLTGSPHAMSIAFSISLTSSGYIKAVISTTPPILNGVITDWRFGPTSGIISEVKTYTSSLSSISINVHDSASISGKTIYLYLYQTNDGYGPYIYNGYYTTSGMPTASLTYHIKHTLSVSAGTGSSITVYRRVTTYGSIGNLGNGATIYDGDVLTITATPNTNYRILTLTVNRSPFTSGGTHTVTENVSVVSTAQVLASSIGATDANIESNSTITITKYNADYYHEITVCFGNIGRRKDSSSGTWQYITQSGQITTERTRFSDTSVSFAIPASFYAEIPNEKTGTCYVTCWTYSAASGGSVMGDAVETSFIVTAASSRCAPVVSGVVVDTNAVTNYLTGDSSVLVRYKSSAQCTITASSRNSATLTAKTINGVTPTNDVLVITDDNLYNSNFVFAAADSRGYSASDIKTPTMVQYVKLTANPTFYRTSPTSGEVALSFNGNFFNGSFGAYENQIVAGYRYRRLADAAFGSWIQIPSSNITKGIATYRSTSDIILEDYNGDTNGFDYRESYVFEFLVADGYNPWASTTYRLSTVSQVATVKEGIPVFDWGKTDFRFNVPIILGNTQLSENQLQRLIALLSVESYAVGDIFVTTRSGNPATLLGYGTWSQIKDRFLLAAGDTYTAGDTGGSATMAHTHTTAGHQLTVSEMPSHGGHVYNEARGGNWKGFLSSSNATSYGSRGRGWNVTAGNELHPAGDNLGGGGSHSHGDTGAASNADNMPPYMAVYMWLRTA